MQLRQIALQQVKNNGTRSGKEVVQLYVEDRIASVVVPNKQLKGFEKVTIPAGQSTQVSIDIAVQDLGLWNVRMQYVVEPGEFVVYMGGSSNSSDLTNFAVVTVS